MAEYFAERARKRLAAWLAAELPAALAAVETEHQLAANALGRPKVIEGLDPSDVRDGKVEVYFLRGGPEELNDRGLFAYSLEVAITLLSADAQLLPVQTRMLRWQTAWWRVMGRGATTMDGAALAALCSEFAVAQGTGERGEHVAVAIAPVEITMQEAA